MTDLLYSKVPKIILIEIILVKKNLQGSRNSKEMTMMMMMMTDKQTKGLL